MTESGDDGNNQNGLSDYHAFRCEQEPEYPQRAAPGEHQIKEETYDNSRDGVEGLDQDDNCPFAPEFVKVD